MSCIEGGCDLNNCTEWSDCKIEKFDWKKMLSGEIKGSGIQNRTCYCKDKKNYTEQRECQVYKELIIEKGEECFATHYYIRDAKTNSTLAKVKAPSLEKGLDIKFITKKGEIEYCWYCFNGKQDYDETGIDCGGSCPKCVEVQKPKARGFPYLLALAIIAGAIIIISAIRIIKKQRQKNKSSSMKDF